jgi:hypothetical protein
MMNENVELDRWRLLWQARADGPDAADLRHRVERETRRRKAALIAPVLVTLFIGGGTTALAVATRGTQEIAVAIEAWLFIAVTWGVALWIDRGTWAPLGNATTAFVDISIRRCRSDITGLRVAVLLYVGQFVAILALKQSLSPVPPLDLLTAWPVVLLGWVVFPLFLVWTISYGRSRERELRRLLELRRQLTE